MQIYNHPVFQMASQQFDEVADYLQLPQAERDWIKYPKRALAFTVPIRRDNGEIEVFSGYRVQHHLALGPAKGGVRFHPEVELGEVAALAMWMSWKCSLTGLPYGGAKGGVTCDPTQLSVRELERISRRYAQELVAFISPETDVLGPDMGTNDQTMAWMMDTYSGYCGHPAPGIATGKPVSLGGSLGRRESTGRGVAYLVNQASGTTGLDITRATVVIQGFGNVGSVAALALAKYGAKIVAVSDVYGGLYNAQGLNLAALEKHFAQHNTVVGFPEAEPIANDQLLLLPCDILVPAALARQITAANAGKLQCRILAEGANGPTTPEADAILRQRPEIFVIPDILCNAGGVVVSYFEWVQNLQSLYWSETEVMDRLFGILGNAYTQVCDRSRQEKISMRQAAMVQGVKRVVEAHRLRGLFP